MFTKNYVEDLKTNHREDLYRLLQQQSNNGFLIYLLDNLGRLPSDIEGEYFIPLTQSKDDRIRYLAIKNIGKLCNDKYLNSLAKIALEDRNSKIRREAVSSIGRMHSKRAIPYLLRILTDRDPKVVLQAIRALLVFKSEQPVQNVLTRLKSHPNETVQYVINKEFALRKPRQDTLLKHTESPNFMKNMIVQGDIREILQCVPDESIHLAFTSPPYYNARDYSTYQSYDEYLQFLATVFAEVHRVTKEGRFFVLNTSPVIVPRFSRQHSSKRYPIPYDIHSYLTKMGWEFIDDIIWLKPEASVKNRNAGFLQHRKPLAYKPNPVSESVMVYRKKTDKLIDWAIRQYDFNTINKSKVIDDYETSNVWRIDPTFDKDHSAVFPYELCNRVIRFYSYIGDLVFDPFAGSGTFGRAAVNLNRYFFLTEIECTFIERMRKDLAHKSILVEPKPRILDTDEFKIVSRGIKK